MPPIATYVFFGLGTTDLRDKNPKITELHMLAITSPELRRYFRDGGEENFADLPDESNLHCRLEDEVMWFQSKEYRDPEECVLKDEIIHFLNDFQKPLCLIANNGPKFHFPLLRSELAGAKGFSTEVILCADSMAAFYDIWEPDLDRPTYAERVDSGSFPWPYQAGGKSYRFKDVCQRVLGFEPMPNNAEVCNKAMVRVALSMPYEFMLWVAKNCYPFTAA